MAIDLITLAEYKTYAGISSTNQDIAIRNLIPQVSNLAKQLCRRTFVDYVDDYKTEVFKGGVDSRILLQETPLLQIASVEFSDDFGKTYRTLAEFTDYAVDQEADAVQLIAHPYIGYTKLNAFRVTYNAGYEQIPADLKLAIADLITYYLRNESAIHSNKGVGSNSVQIEYVTNTGLPAHIRRVLDQHTAFYG